MQNTDVERGFGLSATSAVESQAQIMISPKLFCAQSKNCKTSLFFMCFRQHKRRYALVLGGMRIRVDVSLAPNHMKRKMADVT